MRLIVYENVCLRWGVNSHENIEMFSLGKLAQIAHTHRVKHTLLVKNQHTQMHNLLQMDWIKLVI